MGRGGKGVLERDSETEDTEAYVYADSSDDGVPLDPDKRARARGHGGGRMSSLQSKWDTAWKNNGEDAGEAPEGWPHAPHSSGASTQLEEESEELVGDRLGGDGEDGDEEGRMWGMHEEHRTGNVYTPGDPTGRDRRPPKIIDRGSLTDSAGLGRARKTGAVSRAGGSDAQVGVARTCARCGAGQGGLAWLASCLPCKACASSASCCACTCLKCDA